MATVFGFAFMGAASAADITIYYSPSCPHCHHALDFIGETLIYEYPQIKVTQVNVMEDGNLPLFEDALKQCEYESGGVPVMVVGEKCFQGYADFMQDDIRAAIEVDMSDADKQAATENKAKMAADPAGFKAANADRADAVTDANVAEKHGGKSAVLFGALVAMLIVGLGAYLIRRNKRN